MLGLIKEWLKRNKIQTNAIGGSTHSFIQRYSKQCVGCSKKLLVTGETHKSATMARGVYSVSLCGGKIYCDNCDIKPSNFCVHGYLLSNDCEYCPDMHRIESEGELKRQL